MLLKISRTFGTKTLLNFCKRAPSLTKMFSSKVEEKKINVHGSDINYVRKGTGPHPVLLLPGALGSAWTDFEPQIENLDGSKMTIIAWDPPGYGKSRPPDRKFDDNFFEQDARVAHDFMKALGFDSFSLVGWSDGGITSFILAANNPKSVRKLVAFGANSYILASEMKIYESIRNIDTWSERMRAPLIALYGEDYFKKTWSSWVDAMSRFYHKNDGDICKSYIPKILCPTLIIYGANDPLVHPAHPQFLKQNIPNAKLEIFDKGAHNLHLKYNKEFNELVTKFLVE